jgi:hypothetical protein
MTVGRIPSIEGGIQPTIVDAKGDLITAVAADTPARIAVGANDTVLTADSTTATGLKWATPASGSTFSGSRVYSSSATSIPNGTITIVNFNTEVFDVGGYHDNSTNNSRFTIPAGKGGYVLIYGILKFAVNGGNNRQIYIRKNGTTRIVGGNEDSAGTDYSTDCQATLIDDCVPGDYYELAGVQDTGGSLNTVSGINGTNFMITYLGA